MMAAETFVVRVELTCGDHCRTVGVTVEPWIADVEPSHDSVAWELTAPEGFTLGISNAGPPEAWPFRGMMRGWRSARSNVGALDPSQLPEGSSAKVDYQILIEGRCETCGRHHRIVLDPEMHIRR